jgi:hypothetical protein
MHARKTISSESGATASVRSCAVGAACGTSGAAQWLQHVVHQVRIGTSRSRARSSGARALRTVDAPGSCHLWGLRGWLASRHPSRPLIW